MKFALPVSLLLLLFDHPAAFVLGLTSVSHHRYTTNFPRWLRRFETASVAATVYLPEDWVDDRDDLDGATSTTTTSLSIPSILQSPEWVAPLARIAAEYTKRLTPTIGHINVQQIEHVSVTNVAPSHVDIEAIVCENDACVSLSVPVPFTQPCITTPTTTTLPPPQLYSSFEDCVIRSIQELDTVQLQQQAITDPNNRIISSNSVEASPIEYPSWWVDPNPSMEFTRECQSLIQILNEIEFQKEISILVTKELYRMLNMCHDDINNSRILQLQSAVAVAVGPKGMIFRVRAVYEQQLETVDVPIPFSSHGLLSIRDEQDPLSLRNAVLHCIENVVP